MGGASKPITGGSERAAPGRGLKRDHTARVIMRGHALMQNIRRGHYELGASRIRQVASTSTSKWHLVYGG
jgi:hypothetical protein